MPPNFPSQPTAAELEILHLLWLYGPATVRALNERQNTDREVGYTTTLKLLQIMIDKGLVARDDTARQHIYRAAVAESTAQAQLLTSFVDSAFRGSASQLVLRALGTGTAPSAGELAQIRALLDELENPTSPAQ
ncbi:MAG: BlaI/MecI/CopY family transcriptional regulator [Hymenobacteraceae bacterium]|nr:BlaI/MecI/CopY family transcriptional regulator [Hymenobacteraceae bacterium]